MHEIIAISCFFLTTRKTLFVGAASTDPLSWSYSDLWPEPSLPCPEPGCIQHAAFVTRPSFRWSFLTGKLYMAPCSRQEKCPGQVPNPPAKLETALTISIAPATAHSGLWPRPVYSDANHGSPRTPWGAPSLLQQILPVGIFSRCAAWAAPPLLLAMPTCSDYRFHVRCI